MRVENCIKAGNDKKIILGVDNGKWYDLKRNINQGPSSHCNDPDTGSSRLKWSKFPTLVIPQYFNKGHIYTYIINEHVSNADPSIEESTPDDITTTVKPFRRGSQYVDSDHISEVFNAKNNNSYYVKCKCQASFKKMMKYDVEVILNCTSGAVIKGVCTCKQSALGKCVHVTALLLFIWEYVKENGNIPVACTSKPREWGLGSNIRNPGSVSKTKYPIRRYNPAKRSSFDPRPENYKWNFDTNKLLSAMQIAGRDTNLESIWKITYEDFEYSIEDLRLLKKNVSIFLKNMEEMINSFPASITEIPGTIQGSEEWLRWRTYFITSSNVKIVTSIKSHGAKKNFLLKNFWQCTKRVETEAMRYGKINEANARLKYNLFLEDDQRVVQVGLVVNSSYPFFATSVDGVVVSRKGIDHIIEIKCPKLLENKLVHNFDKILTKNQLSNFFLIKEDGEIKIRKNHPYLYQICMSLLIFNVEMCSLVVWSSMNVMVIPVMRNDYLHVIEEIKDKGYKFYRNIYVPEMFAMRTVRGLLPIELKD